MANRSEIHQEAPHHGRASHLGLSNTSIPRTGERRSAWHAEPAGPAAVEPSQPQHQARTGFRPGALAMAPRARAKVSSMHSLIMMQAQRQRERRERHRHRRRLRQRQNYRTSVEAKCVSQWKRNQARQQKEREGGQVDASRVETLDSPQFHSDSTSRSLMREIPFP